jgi:hypothetical protein
MLPDLFVSPVVNLKRVDKSARPFLMRIAMYHEAKWCRPKNRS